jgi:glycosyltransferase involved in cell wall biosynthesis
MFIMKAEKPREIDVIFQLARLKQIPSVFERKIEGKVRRVNYLNEVEHGRENEQRLYHGIRYELSTIGACLSILLWGYSDAMKILIVHVPYEHRGGEEVHVDALVQGYEKIGVTPILYPENRNPPRSLLLKSVQSLLPIDNSPEIEKVWSKHRPAYIHLHNAFPILGPRFFRWAIANKVPLVMTVHNHRLFCTNGLALRNKKICKDCFSSKVAWRPIAYNCNGDWKKTIYHSLALTQMRLQDLYNLAVHRFVAVSPYLQAELVRMGIPQERVLRILNPVFWSEHTPAEVKEGERYDAIYAGRLSQEKGIQELLATIRLLPNVQFLVAGDGPERPKVEAAARDMKNLEFMGAVSHERVLDLISQSRIAVLPSICNEALSTFALEAFSQGKRCVVPALDSTSWLASGDFPGHLAKPSDPADLARSIETALESPRIDRQQMADLQKKLGFDRFCSELSALAGDMMKATAC